MPINTLIVNAVLCERVLREKDDVLTAVRMVDAVLFNAGTAPKVDFVVLAFVKSDVAQSVNLTIQLTSPSGSLKVLGTRPLTLGSQFGPSAPQAMTAVIELSLRVRDEGTYWIDVLVDGEPKTRLPFTLVPRPLEETQPSDSISQTGQ
jgi:hypothetical protein